MKLQYMPWLKEESQYTTDSPRTWQGLYRQISDLPLNLLEIVVFFKVKELWSVDEHWISFDEAQITRFLKSRGNKIHAYEPWGMALEEHRGWYRELRRKAEEAEAER